VAAGLLDALVPWDRTEPGNPLITGLRQIFAEYL
jgi:hypothetical protein